MIPSFGLSAAIWLANRRAYGERSILSCERIQPEFRFDALIAMIFSPPPRARANDSRARACRAQPPDASRQLLGTDFEPQ